MPPAYHFSPKRSTCFSLFRRHRIFRFIVPLSFITISVILFLKIQHFVEELASSSKYKTIDLKTWDEKLQDQRSVIRNSALLSNPDVIDKSMYMAREYYANNSYEILLANDSLSQNKSIHQHQERLQKLSAGQDNLYLNHQMVRSATETVKRSRHEGSTTNPKKDDNRKLNERGTPLLAVILVISRPNNVLLRLAARRTWAEYTDMYKILVRFVVGRQENWSDIVDRESTMHKDVIIFDENDTIDALPSKVIQGFQWAVDLKPPPLFIMKIDDDTMVNLPYLTKELFRPTFSSSQILGAIRTKVDVIRDPNDQWSVNMLDYPASTYPPYASGAAYVMHTSAAKTLLQKRYFTTTWVPLEDVYLTGFVAAQAGIGLKHHRGFAFVESEKVSPCDFVQNKMINSVNNTMEEFYDMYKEIEHILRTKNVMRCHAKEISGGRNFV